MALTPEGSLAKASVQSMQLAELMQGKTVTHIKEQFEAAKSEELSIENLTWERFQEELANASETGQLEEFNDRLIEMIIRPVIEQALAPEEEQQ